MFQESNGLYTAYKELLKTTDVLELDKIRYADWEEMSADKYKLLQQADYAYLLHRVNQIKQNANITSVILYCQRRGLIDQNTEEGRTKYQRRHASAVKECERRLALAGVQQRKRRKKSE